MSRGQEAQVLNTAQQQNATQATNAQTSYNAAQGDIGDYAKQAAQFAAENPYVQGGQYQTAQNQSLANTADASGTSAGQAVQGAAVRTGQNAGGAIAGTEAMQQQNERNLAAQEATANQQRIGSQATYNAEAVKNAEVPAQLETALTGQQLTAGNEELSTAQRAAQDPSFADTLGSSFAQAFGSGVGTVLSHGCWVAAYFYGGWDDPRVHTVRLWIWGPFAERWWGALAAALYARYGRQAAERMQRGGWTGRLLERGLKPLFDAALRRAQSTERRAQGTGLRAQGAELRAQEDGAAGRKGGV